MKKNDILKKFAAFLLAAATLCSFVGCAAKQENNGEDPAEVIGEVIEEKEPEVIEEPKVVYERFDITDDAVFNAKVDELYAKIEGACANRSDYGLYCIDSREKVTLFFALLNISSISQEQLHYITDYSEDMGNILDNLILASEAITIRNSSNMNDYVSLTDYYVGSDENIEFLKSYDKLALEIHSTENISEESVNYLNEALDAIIDDAKNGTQSEMVNVIMYQMLCCADGYYEDLYGYYNFNFDNFYERYETEVPNHNLNIRNESIDDLKANLSRLSTS